MVDHSAVVFTHEKHSTSNATMTSFGQTQGYTHRNGRNRPFGAPVTSARFFYMDQFVLLAIKNSLHMYKYTLDHRNAKKSQSAALKSLSSEGSYRRAHYWTLESQSITCFNCINSIRSNLILIAGSDKKLAVVDASTGSISRHQSSLHDTAVSCIAVPQPSMHVQLPIGTYNIFVTSAKVPLSLIAFSEIHMQ